MSKHREAMELEFADNPVLERTIPREMLEIIEAASNGGRREMDRSNHHHHSYHHPYRLRSIISQSHDGIMGDKALAAP